MTDASRNARPLDGRRIVVTRARRQATELTERLSSLGATVIALPAIEIQPVRSHDLDAALRQLGRYDWIIFTSANAVDIVFDRLRELSIDPGQASRLRVGAIGNATATRIASHGLRVDFVPDDSVAESLVSGLADIGVEGSRVLLPRARVARDVLPDGLREAGAAVDVVVAYETRKATPDAAEIQELRRIGADCVTFTSQSSVRHTLDLLGGRLPDGALVACIGPVTGNAARAAGLPVDILAADYSATGLVDALVAYYGVGRKARDA